MSCETTFDGLNDRILDLERQSRRQRCALWAIPAVLIALGAAAESDEWIGKSIVAQKMSVVDAEGRERILLTCEDGDPILHLKGTEENRFIVLAVVDGEDPVGKFRGKRGSAHLGINPDNDRPMFELVDENAKLLWGIGGNALD